jgi:taurine dioxygenase
MASDGVRIEPASPALGSVVHGVDLSRPVADDTWAAVLDALRASYLLVFPAQHALDDDGHVAVARRFGPVAEEGFPPGPVTHVSNLRPGGILGSDAASFHIDYGFFPQPYPYLSLCAVDVPRSGAETWFVNGVLAASTLTGERRNHLRGLSARQAIDVAAPGGQAAVRVRVGRLDESYPHQVRPVLWPHRDDGREILAVWQQHTDAILPLPPEESTALIEDLYRHLYRPEHTYVHRWQRGDLLVWDNHALQHGRPDVGVAELRTLRRVAVGAAQDLALFAAYRARGSTE